MDYLLAAAQLMESEEAVVPQYNSAVPQYHQPSPDIRRHSPYQRYQPHVQVPHAAAAAAAATYSYYAQPMLDTVSMSRQQPQPRPALHASKVSDDDEATDDDMRVPVSAGSRGNSRPGTANAASSLRGGLLGNNAHNEVEKRRRAYLTQCYNELHKILPTIAGTKASNATVLRSATDHIKALEREEQMLCAAKKQQLKIRQAILARRARAARQPQPMGMAVIEIKPQAMHLSNSDVDEAIPMSSEDEGGALVPDNASRPVSPNLSPKEDLTQLASPIRKVSKTAKVTAVVVGGGPIRGARRGGRGRARNIMIGE